MAFAFWWLASKPRLTQVLFVSGRLHEHPILIPGGLANHLLSKAFREVA